MKRDKTIETEYEPTGNGAHRCRQSQCVYWREGGCKACDECGAAPYEINEDCARCYACENLPNAIRWGDENAEQMQKSRQIIKKKQERKKENATQQDGLVVIQ